MRLAVWIILLALAPAARSQGVADRMTRAHSHNDYERTHPLADALAHGYHSVEADVWWRDGQVLVSHLPFGFKGTLEGLYLQPLQTLVDRRGSVHGDGLPFHLWIDIKESTQELTDALGALLDGYSMFAESGGAGPVRGPVIVILTGNEPSKRRLASPLGTRKACRDSNRFSAHDPIADERWTWYALRWRAHFSWDGHGPMGEAERRRLRALVASVHGKGRRLRLFHTPETEAFWAEALAAGVDLIGTDEISALSRFLEHGGWLASAR